MAFSCSKLNCILPMVPTFLFILNFHISLFVLLVLQWVTGVFEVYML